MILLVTTDERGKKKRGHNKQQAGATARPDACPGGRIAIARSCHTVPNSCFGLNELGAGQSDEDLATDRYDQGATTIRAGFSITNIVAVIAIKKIVASATM